MLCGGVVAGRILKGWPIPHAQSSGPGPLFVLLGGPQIEPRTRVGSRGFLPPPPSPPATCCVSLRLSDACGAVHPQNGRGLVMQSVGFGALWTLRACQCVQPP